ncbi:glycoside hydrolase family 57 protein [Algisphaera agarilytica]|uniref:Alpha-amylase n=1 Tax=Algisphaera agarilytica TaxID=1385975 RepID=A0A7X0LJ15_9BACT|nr:glycoside hydrolase family 57 protein [Algisphaera agarilytica]MBB6428372.1 alpha-amylase [Algisphaera agarilytica]
MTAVNLYFQIHQPHRLRRYSVFDASSHYFDDDANEQILRKVAAKCYLPATRILLQQVKRHAGDFRLAFSITGCVLDQLRQHSPDVVDNFRKLSQTGCVEFLSETYDHSLASIYNHDEFISQVLRHSEVIDDLFGQTPVVFRNTELIYSNALASLVDHAEPFRGRFRGVLTEGADQVLAGRSPNRVYGSPEGLPLLLKNYELSDDIAFRFTNPISPGVKLKATRYAAKIASLEEQEAAKTGGDISESVCNLFMDFETFGEHQWKDTGILDFLAELPGAILSSGQRFLTPRESIDEFEPVDTFDCPQSISWADSERDLSAWAGNAMQASALNELYKLRESAINCSDPEAYRDWRRLSTSDHFYYMCTKYYADGDVHQYFSPYESPYDSYINFMNVLDNLRARCDASAALA